MVSAPVVKQDVKSDDVLFSDPTPISPGGGERSHPSSLSCPPVNCAGV